VTGLPFSTRALGIGALALLAGASLHAQGRGGGGPRYDASTEATVSGTVESVEQIKPGTGGGRRGLGGTHLRLKTKTETLDVHLGPATFLTEKKVEISNGDTLAITGSRVTVDGEGVLIAREVRKGDTTWTLRDAAGLPLWRGSGRRP
jgi:hypothetical protein